MASSETEQNRGLPLSQDDSFSASNPNSPTPPTSSSSGTNEITEHSSASRRGNELPSSSPTILRQSVPGQVRITTTIRSQPTASGTTPPQQPTNNNNGEFPQAGQNLFHMRDRLFLALFFRVSLIYARAFPRNLRRFIEFCLLMQSIVLLFILGYIHVVYTQTPITCLSEYRNSWPKDGILRVEITTDTSVDYDITKSYEKEERLRQRAAASQMGQYSDDLLTMMLTADTIRQSFRVLFDRVVSTAGELINSVTSNGQEAKSEGTSMTPSAEEVLKPSETSSVDNTISDGDVENQNTKAVSEIDESSASSISKNTSENDGISDDVSAPGMDESIDTAKQMEFMADDAAISPSFVHTASGESPGSSLGPDGFDVDTTDPESVYFNKTFEEIEELKSKRKKSEEETILKSSVSDFEMFANSVWLQDQAYIVEYALEYGFLRLSPETRQRLNIPVKIVTLDPSKQSCFGDTFSRFLLDNFLGYDDILMASIKNLAESEENKGYLRNVVTGEQFRFVPMWMARSAYIPSLLIMLVFTVSISMLLRYSHHQIFVFIVDLLNNIEGAGAIHIPAAPLFTVILALVGMEAIMSEFFSDTSTAFYVILIVWIADQYDSVCSHTQITRTYWVRFFYLYHFAFYAYHYRFNGQYGGLALLVSWSFIQHSMVYFYHHYELPTILRQARGATEERNTSRSPTPSSTPTQVVRNDTGPGMQNSSVNPDDQVQTEPVRTEESTSVQTSSSMPIQSSINNGNLTSVGTQSPTFSTSATYTCPHDPGLTPLLTSTPLGETSSPGSVRTSDIESSRMGSENLTYGAEMASQPLLPGPSTSANASTSSSATLGGLNLSTRHKSSTYSFGIRPTVDPLDHLRPGGIDISDPDWTESDDEPD